MASSCTVQSIEEHGALSYFVSILCTDFHSLRCREQHDTHQTNNERSLQLLSDCTFRMGKVWDSSHNVMGNSSILLKLLNVDKSLIRPMHNYRSSRVWRSGGLSEGCFV